MNPTENNTHCGAAEFEEGNNGKPPHVVIMMPDTPPQSILKPKSNAFWTKKRIVCVVVAILVLIGGGVGGAIWYFYPREKESTSTSSSMHATQKPLLPAPPTITDAEVAFKDKIAAEKAALKTRFVTDETTVLRFGGIDKGKDAFVVNMNINTTFVDDKGTEHDVDANAIIGDFNNPKQMNQMAEAFPQKFDYIMFDGRSAEYFKVNVVILQLLRKMLKQSGKFIYEIQTKDDIASIESKLKQAGFDIVERIPAFEYRLEPMIKILKYEPKTRSQVEESGPSLYNVLKCSNYKKQIENAKTALDGMANKSLTIGGIPAKSGISVIINNSGDDSRKIIFADFNDPTFMRMMRSEFKDSFTSISIAADAHYTINFLTAIYEMLELGGTFKCPSWKNSSGNTNRDFLGQAGFADPETEEENWVCKKTGRPYVPPKY